MVTATSDIDGDNADDNSGFSVSISNGTIIAVGSTGNDGNGNRSGHVRLYYYTNGSWTQVGADINGEYAEDWSSRVSMSYNGLRTVLDDGKRKRYQLRIWSGYTVLIINQQQRSELQTAVNLWVSNNASAYLYTVT